MFIMMITAVPSTECQYLSETPKWQTLKPSKLLSYEKLNGFYPLKNDGL